MATRKPITHTAGTSSGGYGTASYSGGGSLSMAGGNTAPAPTSNNQYQTQISQLLMQMMQPQNVQNLQDMAHNMYASHYGQLQLAAQQAHDSSVLALQQQVEKLGRTYDRQRQESAQQYAQAVSAADRRAMARGMGRSSYNLQTLANLEQAGADAQNQLWQYQTEDENHINQQIAQAGHQLAQQIQQYQQGQASDELSWVQQQQLHGQEQQNATNQFLLNFLAGQQQNAIANQQWLMNYQQNADQFAQQMGLNWAQYQTSVDQWNQQHPQTPAASSSGPSTPNKPTTPASTTPTTPGDFQSWWQGLGGGSTVQNPSDNIAYWSARNRGGRR